MSSVTVVDHYDGGKRHELTGTDQRIRKELLFKYPFLVPHGAKALPDLVTQLDQAQAHSAVLHGDHLTLFTKAEEVTPTQTERMLGATTQTDRYVAAAEFLFGSAPGMLPDGSREAFLEFEHDPEAYALWSVGQAPSNANRAALRGVLAAGIAKAESSPKHFDSLLALTQDGAQFLEMVRRANDYAGGGIEPVELGGKHSSGALIATDYGMPDSTGRVLLLKPGAGKQSPAAGARDSGSTQAARECAFWAAAEVLGLDEHIPEAHLLLLDHTQYAAMEFLPSTYRTALEYRKDDMVGLLRMFSMHLASGRLHQLAAMDFVLGQTDRHAGNIMVRDDDIQLIDHGAAFAGPGFAPATDRKSFVPFYLRAFAGPDFSKMPPEEKFRALPRVSPQTNDHLTRWVGALDAESLRSVMARFGIQTQPTLARFAQLQDAVRSTAPDVVINGLWVLP